MFEDGGGEDAEALIAEWLPGYDRSGILHGHIAWDAALSALERDDPQRALKIYAEHVQPSVTRGMPINVVSDTVSGCSALAPSSVAHMPRSCSRFASRPPGGPARLRLARNRRADAPDQLSSDLPVNPAPLSRPLLPKRFGMTAWVGREVETTVSAVRK